MTLKRLTIYLFVFFPVFLNFSWAKESKKPEEKVDSSITKTYTIRVETKYGQLVAQIHAHESHRPMVSRISEILHHESRELLEYFQWIPDDTIHIIIKEAVNSSNGFATVFPRLKIEINDFPPVGYNYLNSSGDWLKNLLLHELVHIIHMSQHRGVVDWVNTLFGSIGRSMTGLVPRWFSEGIAVWAETKFTDSGRLRDEMMLFESRKALLSKQFCKTTDCLSVPGKYPYGHAPYWLGGMFMNFLEKQRPGTIRCLIQNNSKKIPFFLNEVFQECLKGENLEQAFQRWMDFELNLLNESQKTTQSIIDQQQLKALDFSDKATVWYKGAELRGDELFYVENNESRFVDELAILNIFEPTLRQLVRTQGPLMSISKINPTPNEIQLEEIPYLSDVPPDWWSFNTQSKKEELLTDKGANLYYFQVEEKKSYVFRYDNFSWKLLEINDVNEKLIKKFSDSEHIYWPYINSKKSLEFLTYDSKEALYQHHTLGGHSKLGIDFTYKGQLYLLDRCGDHSIFKVNNDKFGIFKDGKLTTFKDALASNIVQFKGSELATLYWFKTKPNNVYVSGQTCDEFIKSLRGGFVLNKSPQKNKINESVKNEFFESNFQRWKHLAPKYWFASILIGDTVNFYRIFTSLSDPTEKLNMLINFDHYPSISKIGGDYGISYLFKNDWSISGFFNQSFNVSTIDGAVENQSAVGAGVGKSKSFGRWDYRLSLTYLEAKENDYLSSRKSKRYNVSQSLSMNKHFNDDFINRFDITASVYKQNTEGRTNFIGQDYFLNTSYYLADFWMTHWNLAYSRMDKRDILSGSIFAGERNSHSFYGLDTSSAFSNELANSRLQFDFKIFDSYRDIFGMPILLKQTRLLLGAEWLKADYIFLGSKFLIKNDITSIHAGLRLKTHAFYYLPITVDTIFAQTRAKDGTTESRYFFQMDAFLF